MANGTSLPDIVVENQGKKLTAEQRKQLAPRGSGGEITELVGLDPERSEIENTLDKSLQEASERLGVPQATVLRLRRGISDTVTSDSGQAGELELQAFQEREAIGGDNVIGVQPNFFDASRGVSVHAPGGKQFELLEGGGVRLTDSLDKVEPSKKSSLFAQATSGGAPTQGFVEEQLGLQPAAGKTIARTGRTGKNPQTGVDVPVGPDEIFIEYTDGTFEIRKVGNIQQPGEAQDLAQAGPTAQELGITRQTEIKGGEGTEVTRAPFSASEALQRALAESPEAADEIIQQEGNISTRELTFLPDRPASDPNNALFQAPDGTILERPKALAPLAKQGIGQQAIQQAQNIAFDATAALGNLGIGVDTGAIQINPIGSATDIYQQILGSMGLEPVNTEIANIQKELEKVDQKFADRESQINENPWISEGERVGRLRKAEEKFQRERELLVNRLALFQDLNDQARQDAKFLTTTTINQHNQEVQNQLDQLQLAFNRADEAFDRQVRLANLELSERQQSQREREFQAELALSEEELNLRRFQTEASVALDQAQFGLSQARESRISSGRSRGGGGSTQAAAPTPSGISDSDLIGIAQSALSTTELNSITKLGTKEANRQLTALGSDLYQAVQEEQQQSLPPGEVKKILSSLKSQPAQASTVENPFR